MSIDVVLRTDHLGKQFKERWAARDVDLEIHRGDVFGFLGPNGAGKSTTIRMILSLIAPTEGSVELFGRDLASDRERALAKVAGIVEKPDFYLYLTAFRNMQIAGALTLGHAPERRRIMDALTLVGLGPRAFDRVKTYSHGMKQRLGIAQALLCSPELVVLDEPTNGLDPQGMKEVRDLIVRLSRENGITVFLSSHLLNEVEQVATRMAIINKGKLVVQGTVQELLHSNGSKYRFEVAPIRKALEIVSRHPAVRKARMDEGSIVAEIDAKKTHLLVAALVEAGCRVSSVQPQRSLEEFFLKITE